MSLELNGSAVKPERSGVVLFQRTLAPYRISLFNHLAEELEGGLTVAFTQREPPLERRWTVAWSQVAFAHEFLDGWRLDTAGKTREWSTGVWRMLDRVNPRSILVAGWDVSACWAALAWCWRRSVPAHAWVESSAYTGRWRDPVSMIGRRTFLSRCQDVFVPGAAAEEFVRSLSPKRRCVQVPNSIDSPELRGLEAPGVNGAALFLGELSRRKGADIVLRGAEKLLSSFPGLIIAGDGPLREAFISKARELRRLEYVGFVEGPARARCMERASVVLLPSRRDPWPLAACEALVSRRTLVLGPGVGSFQELRALAPDAVVRMASDNVTDLLDAAVAARAGDVPTWLRSAFLPEVSARTMACTLMAY